MTAARRLALLAAFALPAIVYFASASPEPASWDTAELQGVPYILGISHPTGFPFYVLAGYVWSHAVRVRDGRVANERDERGCRCDHRRRGLRACARVRCEHSGRAVRYAVVRVHAKCLVARRTRRSARPRRCVLRARDLRIRALAAWRAGRWFAAAFALCGLGIAAHPNALWILPAFVIGAIIAKRRPRARLVAGSAALVVAGLALYLYLPLRSAYVVANHLDPAAALPGADGGIFWNYNDPRTLHGLVRELTGKRVRNALVLPRVVQSGSSRAGALGVRQHLAPAVRRVGGAPDPRRHRRRRASRLADDARRLRGVHGRTALFGHLSQRERRRTLPAARVVVSRPAFRRAHAAI